MRFSTGEGETKNDGIVKPAADVERKAEVLAALRGRREYVKVQDLIRVSVVILFMFYLLIQ
jgi:hypothetical protein